MRMGVRKCIEISRWSSGVVKSRGRTFKPSSKPPFDPLSLWRKSRYGKILQIWSSFCHHSVPKMFGPDVEVVGGGSHQRLGLHHHPWHPSLGSNINHADHTVITTSGSTHSQKLLLCCFIVQVEANERRGEKSPLVSKMLVKHLKVFPTRWSTKSLSDLVNRVWNRAQPSHIGHYRSTLR